jgi:hypothetical protein
MQLLYGFNTSLRCANNHSKNNKERTMALIKNLKAKAVTARISMSLPEQVLRRLDAYRLYLGEVNGYLPDRAETIEQFLLYVFSEDKAFTKWYQPANAAQAARLDALQNKDAPAPSFAAKPEESSHLAYE